MIQDLKSLAIIDPENAGGLIAFYREKLSQMENERTQLIQELGNMRGDLEQNHKQQWQNMKLENEYQELDRQFTDLKMKFLQTKSLNIEQENQNKKLFEELKKEQIKVSELLAHVQPVSEQIVLREGKKPKFHYKFIKTSSKLNSINKLKEKYITQPVPSKFTLHSKIVIENGNNTEQKPQNNQIKDQSVTSEKQYFDKLKQLENENDVLKNQNKNLEKMIDKQLLQNEQLNSNFLKEKKILLEKIQKLERINQELNTQYFEQKQFFSQKETILNENLEIARIKVLSFQKNIDKNLKDTKQANYLYNEMLQNKQEEIYKKFQKQIKDQNKQILYQKKESDQIKEIFANKQKQKEQEIKQLKNKLQKYSDFENLKSQGLKRENKILKDKIDEFHNNLIFLQSIQKKKENIKDKKQMKNNKVQINDNQLAKIQKTIKEISKKIQIIQKKLIKLKMNQKNFKSKLIFVNFV